MVFGGDVFDLGCCIYAAVKLFKKACISLSTSCTVHSNILFNLTVFYIHIYGRSLFRRPPEYGFSGRHTNWHENSEAGWGRLSPSFSKNWCQETNPNRWMERNGKRITPFLRVSQVLGIAKWHHFCYNDTFQWNIWASGCVVRVPWKCQCLKQGWLNNVCRMWVDKRVQYTYSKYSCITS